ncbi:hypothetical protein G7046_g4670 [Stylonectria norvegica]|nr:hypothetical protein G7046_g4670 [Stylonectria norvegica]
MLLRVIFVLFASFAEVALGLVGHTYLAEPHKMGPEGRVRQPDYHIVGCNFFLRTIDMCPIRPTIWQGGYPTQRYKYRQVTKTIECLNTTCALTHKDAKSYVEWYTISAQITSTVKDAWAFVAQGKPFRGTAQFQHTGKVKGVTGCKGEPHETVCMWWRQAYTTYYVLQKESGHMDKYGNLAEFPWRLYSPNKDGVGSVAFCGKGNECRNQGDVFWGPASDKREYYGGPRDYPFSEQWK